MAGQFVASFEDLAEAEIAGMVHEDDAGWFAGLCINDLVIVLDKEQCARLGRIATETAALLGGGRYDKVPE